MGYFGDGPWSHRSLDLIAEDINIELAFICARWDRPDEYLKKRAGELGIEFLVSENVNSNSFISRVKKYDADIFVSMSFDQIMKNELYSLPTLGSINCHAGKLPLYRGRNILNWVLINDEKEFGITVHYIDDGVDTGDIIVQNTYGITDKDNYESLLNVAYEQCPIVLKRAIDLIQSGKAKRTKQSSLSCRPLICTRREEGDERLVWEMKSREIFNFVRALSYPGPGALTSMNSIPVRIEKVELINEAPVYKGIPGAILSKDGGKFIVKTGDSYIAMTDWKSAGKLRVGGRFV